MSGKLHPIYRNAISFSPLLKKLNTDSRQDGKKKYSINLLVKGPVAVECDHEISRGFPGAGVA